MATNDGIKTATDTGPESPTTARPLDLDDDDVQETGILSEDGSHKPTPVASTAASDAATMSGPAASTTGGDAPPPKPPRPISEAQRNEETLKEAFPTVEPSVIRAVLRASGGRVEPAFNALLEMSDPDAAAREEPPPRPPRPTVAPEDPMSAGLSQLEADEQYARQLAQHYENVGHYEERTSSRAYSRQHAAGLHGGQQQQRGYDDDGDRERNFIDDDLPVIRENLRKGFVETQSKVNTWFTNFKKRIDEQFDEIDESTGTARNRNEGGSSQGPRGGQGGRYGADGSRRSADYDRYDADPELLSDDFAGMKFHSDGTPARNQQSQQNPNLFRPPPPSKSPKLSDGRKVAFSDEADENAYDASPRLQAKDGAGTGSATKQSKWQPLSTVDPHPIAENDPFSLGDSEDERDATKEKPAAAAGGESQGITMVDDDSERLRKAAAEAMADSLVDDKPKSDAAAPVKKA